MEKITNETLFELKTIAQPAVGQNQVFTWKRQSTKRPIRMIQRFIVLTQRPTNGVSGAPKRRPTTT